MNYVPVKGVRQGQSANTPGCAARLLLRAPWGTMWQVGPKQDNRTLYAVACACGAKASMDARSFGRPTVCKKCGGSFTVGWGKDPKSRKAVPVAVSLARKRSEAILQVHCTCGYRRPVTPAEAAERNRCPGCGRDMIVEKPVAAKTRIVPPAAAARADSRSGAMLQLHCTCGYRRAVTPAEAAGRNRCPGCGREMIVEKPSAAKARESDRIIKLSSAPSSRRPAPAAPSSVQVVQLPPGTQAFTCLCGERIMVRAATIGSVTQCRICDRKMRVEVKGPETPVPGAPPGGRYPTPPPGPYTKPELSCQCGQSLDVLKAFGADGTVCPRCGQTITMEKFRAPLSNHTIVRPRFGAKAAPPPPPAPKSAPKKPEPEAVFEQPVTEFVEEEEAPFKLARSSYQEVFCPCGEALTVGSDETGKNIQCPTCFTLMAVETIRDGNTGNSVIRVRGIGKMDQDTWSLSDFS